MAGKAVDVNGAPPPCGHRTVNARFEAALIAANEDGSGPIERREVKVLARCGECGCPLRFLPDTARPSKADGDLAVVVDVVPTE